MVAVHAGCPFAFPLIEVDSFVHSHNRHIAAHADEYGFTRKSKHMHSQKKPGQITVDQDTRPLRDMRDEILAAGYPGMSCCMTNN